MTDVIDELNSECPTQLCLPLKSECTWVLIFMESPLPPQFCGVVFAKSKQPTQVPLLSPSLLDDGTICSIILYQSANDPYLLPN